MTEGKFTESDAENDGLVKREAGQQLNSVLARESGKLYTKFRAYCEENDLDPSVVLGDMILRAIRSEEFAQEVSSTVVDVEKLDKGQIRREDLELVTDIIDEFGGNEDEGMDPIDKMLEERLNAVGEGPLGNLSKQSDERRNGKDEKIRRLEREIEELKREAMGDTDTSDTRTRETNTTTQSEEPQDVDSLFDSDGNTDNGDDDVRSDVSDDAVEDGEATEVSDLFDGDDDGGDGDDGSDNAVEHVDLGHEEPEPEDLDEDGPMNGEPEPNFSTDDAEEEVVDDE